ncbi:MAG: TonB-dependent receptor [Pseudomonadota bacterium]
MNKIRSALRQQFSRPGLLVSGLCAVALPAAPALAQQQQALATGTVLEEIIVTATRRAQALTEVPSAITSLDTETLINTGITDINAIADFVPGLTATDGGSPSLGNLTIRGLYAGGPTTTGIYINDVPYGPVLGGFGSSLALDASLLELQRVEVIRGPQGTLYGASSVGGTVRYITREPAMDEIVGHVTADFSNTDNGGDNTLIRGAISVPVIEDTLAVLISGFWEDADGYIDYPLINQEKVNDHEFDGGMLSVKYTPTDALRFRLDYVTQNAEYGAPGYVGFDPVTQKPLLGDLTDINVQEDDREYEFDMFSLNIEYDFDWATFKSITSDQEIVFSNLTDVTESFGPTADAIAPEGAPHTVAFESSFDADRFTQEFQLVSSDSDQLEWIVGLYYTDVETDSGQNTIENPADVALLRANNPFDYEEFAAFGNVTYYLNQDWDVTVGLRYSDYEVEVDAVQEGILVPPGTPAPSGVADEDTVTTYMLNTRYRINDDLNFYARAASGFRPGGVNLVFEIGDMIIGQPSYDPDDLWSYEAGLKGLLFDGNVTYDVGVYYVDWSDSQIAVPAAAGGLGFTTNAGGDVEAMGVEAAITGQFIDNLFVTGSFAWGETELKDDEPLVGGVAGDSLPGLPEITASLALDYRFTLFEQNAYVGATWRYTGEFDTSFEGGVGDGGVVIAPLLANYENDSYDQVDIRAGMDIASFSIGLYGTNITNEDAYQTVYPQVSDVYSQGVVLRPRTYGVNLRYNF